MKTLAELPCCWGGSRPIFFCNFSFGSSELNFEYNCIYPVLYCFFLRASLYKLFKIRHCMSIPQFKNIDTLIKNSGLRQWVQLGKNRSENYLAPSLILWESNYLLRIFVVNLKLIRQQSHSQPSLNDTE